MGARSRRLEVRELAHPAEALLRLAELRPADYPVLFDSASQGPLSRYSMLVAASGDALWLGPTGALQSSGSATPHLRGASGFLDALERWWQATADASGGTAAGPDAASGGAGPVTLPPWRAGFTVFAGYELAGEVEPSLRLPAAARDCGAFALRTPAALVADVASGRVLALAESGAGAQAWLRRLEADLDAAVAAGPAVASGWPSSIEIREDPPEQFLERVAVVQEHILAGDLYQANLSRGWSARMPPGAGIDALYRRLRAANPAPFAVRASWGGLGILSSSPERLMHIDAGRISTRPIAGTRPRRQGEADLAMARELVAHPKERAEHVMLIDLERNDLGRVCEPGSVAVEDFMSVETYAHVHHIVSGVAGRLRPGVGPIAALRAVFPGGTITGCPKVRCMQVIGELEREGRGAYTGSIGWIGLDGDADFNILIRTLTVAGGEIRIRAGAGIVADSVPERELEETRVKARGVLAALGAPA